MSILLYQEIALFLVTKRENKIIEYNGVVLFLKISVKTIFYPHHSEFY